MSTPSFQVSSLVNSSNSSLSEPPEIKKWFSSYTYESPVLDSNEEFCISPKVDDDGECVDKGLYVEDREDGEEEIFVNFRVTPNRQQSIPADVVTGSRCVTRKSDVEARQQDNVPDVEVPAYSDSLLLPSEPPDIANLFSSYAYESPELDSAHFEDSVSGDYSDGENRKFEEKKEDDQVQTTATRALKGLSCFMDASSNSKATIATSARAENTLCYSVAQFINLQQHGSEESNLSDGSNMSTNINLDSSTRGASLTGCSNISNNSVVWSRFNAANVTPIVKEDEAQQTNNINVKSSAKTLDLMASTETCEYMENESNVNQSESGWVLMNHRSRGTCRGNSRKDEEQSVCTKIQAKSIIKKCKADRNIKSAAEDQKAGVVTREVLKESTNFRYSHALESSGKWRCPQKNKPNTGPPLKQLRLEKWVHRK